MDAGKMDERDCKVEALRNPDGEPSSVSPPEAR